MTSVEKVTGRQNEIDDINTLSDIYQLDLSEFHFGNKSDDATFETFGPWEGTIQDAISQLSKSLDSESRFVYAPMLLRGIIDFKAEINDDIQDIYNIAVDISLDTFDQKSDIQSKIDELINLVADNDQLLDFRFDQKQDRGSVDAARPAYLRKAMARLYKDHKGANITFIPFAGGGLIGGLELFTLAKKFGYIGENSKFIPVRYSAGKKQDAHPHLSNDDIVQIKEQGLPVTTFDDDVSSGTTSVLGPWYIKTQLGIPEIKIITSQTFKMKKHLGYLNSFEFDKSEEFQKYVSVLEAIMNSDRDREYKISNLEKIYDFVNIDDDNIKSYLKKMFKEISFKNKDADLFEVANFVTEYAYMIPESNYKPDYSFDELRSQLKVHMFELEYAPYNNEIDFMTKLANSDEVPKPPYSLYVKKAWG